MEALSSMSCEWFWRYSLLMSRSLTDTRIMRCSDTGLGAETVT